MTCHGADQDFRVETTPIAQHIFSTKRSWLPQMKKEDETNKQTDDVIDDGRDKDLPDHVALLSAYVLLVVYLSEPRYACQTPGLMN